MQDSLAIAILGIWVYSGGQQRLKNLQVFRVCQIEQGSLALEVRHAYVGPGVQQGLDLCGFLPYSE